MALRAAHLTDVATPSFARAFAELREKGPECALVFPSEWLPSMTVVDVVVAELDRSPALRSLTLVHPSAAMTFIASWIAMRSKGKSVMATRSLTAARGGNVATAELVRVTMKPGETVAAFARRGAGKMHSRSARQCVLVFDATSVVDLHIADILVEELLQSGDGEVVLVHPTADLGPIAASIRLRLPRLGVTVGRW